MNTKNNCKIAFVSAVLIPLFLSLMTPGIAVAQRTKAATKAFSGPNDADVSYPATEGKIGQKDASALAEIHQAVAASLVPDHVGLEMTGTLTSSFGDKQKEYSTSFAIDGGRRFRLDIQKENGTRSVRIDRDNGKARQSNQAPQELEDIDFVNPLGMPSLLLDIVDRKDSAVVDDGSVTVGDQSLKKVTITLFRPRYGDPVSASFYFDTSTHLLKKGAFLEHSLGNRSLKFLTVMTYGDYRQEQSMLLPHEYSETVNGQHIMSIKVATVSVTAAHETSYFSF